MSFTLILYHNLDVSRVHYRFLDLALTLGQRVHFAEGTNLRCREDPIRPDWQERLAANISTLRTLIADLFKILKNY